MESFAVNQLGSAIAGEVGASVGLLLLLAFWVIPWKGYALWTAAGRKEKWWFIALLVVNTMAILEIFYLFGVAKKKDEIVKFFKIKVPRLKQ